MKKNSKQLHKPLENLVLFSHYSLGRTNTRDGSNLSHIVYPDNTPCLIANLYILSLTNKESRGKKGLSRRGRGGGTIGDYAGKIAQLIRFCCSKKIEFQRMNDDLFCEFMDELRRETKPRNVRQKRKDEITVTSTGKVCLDFLDFIGRFYGDDTFVAPEGVIKGERKTYDCGKNKVKKTYWHHHSFSSGGRIKKRLPISAENIEKLYDAIYDMNSSRFVQCRREMQIEILENTGARRGEIHQIKVSDVINASEMKEPMLRLITLKREEQSERRIPVSRMFINDMLKFIRIRRAKVIENTIGKENDHGYLFIGEHGEQLSADTLSTEIYDIRTFAKIEEQVCNHMFRHTFCTNLFVLLIERHEFENEDRFRQQLLGSETFKAEVMQYTGHKNSDSLEVYITLAFARISGYQKTVSSAEIIRAIKFFDDKQTSLIKKLERGLLSLVEYKHELEHLKKARDEDITMASEKAEIDALPGRNHV
ncbi:TPA: tyrosine-type recombinase/integrase [Vibrio parahaemolyticus]|uniref:tyrosine-type recombinase/integrase n=1 Tax=Vibrio TaxID=662 RepID=UPI0004DF43D9|nr:tyrosine-type recombinase/integrase [Vibrio parahaemolyticus]ATI47248.1 integrase [Vibrio parahaemolyticus]ELA9389107.1 tyrosine-type recombinase/integrase [Vibrio parahaemolyticus]MBE5181205.1 phage integrase family protein [Vibrio parahaemolyticus]MDF4987658.1 tyrosine-type recombinase/integrase [Vibrio parahaemolyticus]MDF5006570.1 tyrosine-type recombinase/integrase [Vibrio parahaemolyticus]